MAAGSVYLVWCATAWKNEAGTVVDEHYSSVLQYTAACCDPDKSPGNASRIRSPVIGAEEPSGR